MVSELSARLMRGHNYNAPTTAYQTTKIFMDLAGCRSSAVVSPTTTTSSSEPMTSITACTEKLHKISEEGRRKKLARAAAAGAPEDEGCFKRRKIDELQFAASRVKEDMEKAGLPFPSLDASLSHHIDLGEEATKKAVKRVCSKTVASSPFLIQTERSCVASATMVDFGNLFTATLDSYSGNSGNSNSSKTNSTTCSSTATVVSSSGSSVCSENNKSVSSSNSHDSDYSIIPARLEDALLEKTKRAALKQKSDEEKAASVATAAQRRAIYESPITIREAFENSDEARLVTLSFAPFLVVHANPAYTEKTGLSPADILGKPFHEVIQDKTLKATTSKASSLTSLHEQVTSLHLQQQSQQSDEKTMAARIKVAVVGPEKTNQHKRPMFMMMDRSYFTHYMISLVEEEAEEQQEEEMESAEATAVTDDDSAGSTVSDALFESAMEDDDSTTAVDVIDSLEIPPLPPISETTSTTTAAAMRLHCGVMG